MEYHPILKRVHWYILVLIAAFIALAWIFFNNQYDLISKINSIREIGNQTVFKSTKKGTLTIKSTDDLRSYNVNQPVSIQIFGDSEGEDIISFDVLLEYDKEAFDTPIVTTDLPAFAVFTAEPETHYSITVAQSPGSQERSIFEDAPILNITMTPKKSGKFEIKIIPNKDEEMTQLISTDSQTLIPQISTFKVNVN